MKDILRKADKMLEDNALLIVKTTQGEKFILTEGNSQVAPLHEAQYFLKRLFLEKFGMFLDSKQSQQLIEYLDIQPLSIDEPLEKACRVYADSECIIYELNKDTRECVLVEKDGVYIDVVSEILFTHSADFQNQVEPDWEVE